MSNYQRNDRTGTQAQDLQGRVQHNIFPKLVMSPDLAMDTQALLLSNKQQSEIWSLHIFEPCQQI